MEADAEKDNKDALALAIEHLGGYAATARALGLKTAWAVQKWRRIPADRVLQMERATQGRVTRYQLRPDLYGDAPELNSEREVA